MSRNKSITKNSVYNILYTATNVFFPLLISMYASRILLAEGVGNVAYAQTIATYFVSLATLGMPLYGMREVAKVSDDQSQMDKLFSELFLLNVATTAVTSAAYVVVILGVESFREEFHLYLICGIPIFANVFNVEWLYRGREEYGFVCFRNIIFKVLSLVMVFLFVRTSSDYIVFAGISGIAAGGNYVFSALRLKHYVKFKWKGLRPWRHFRTLTVFILSTFFGTIFDRVDVTMLGVMTNDTIVGQYEYAYKLVNVIISCCIASTAILIPRLSFYYKRDQRRFEEIIKKGMQAVCFVAFPAAMGIWTLAPQYILLLFGQSFAEAGAILRCFSFLIIEKSLGDLVCYQTVICSGNEKQRIPGLMVAFVLNIVLNAVLIPKYEGIGATIATILSSLFFDLHQFFYIRKCIIIRVDQKSLFQSVVTSGIMCMTVKATLLLQFKLLPQCIISTITGMCIYFVLNLAVRNEFLFEMLHKLKAKLRVSQ